MSAQWTKLIWNGSSKCYKIINDTCYMMATYSYCNTFCLNEMDCFYQVTTVTRLPEPEKTSMTMDKNYIMKS